MSQTDPWSLYQTGRLPRNTRGYAVIPPPKNSKEKALLDAMLRVDHAGEYGANRIYAGQMAVLGRSQSGPLIQVFRVECCFNSTILAP